MDRRGFALPMALWAIVMLSAIVFAVADALRTEQTAVANRLDRTRARWTAMGCLDQLRFAVERELESAHDPTPLWVELDRLTDQFSRSLAPCQVAARAVGDRIAIESVDDETLGAVLTWLTGSPPRGDSLLQAFRDWMDPDTVARPRGAEASWYGQHARPGPGDSLILHPHELAQVRGFETINGLDRWFAAGSAPLSLNHAPLELIAILPGLDRGFRERLIAFRRSGERIPDFSVLEVGDGTIAQEARRARARLRRTTVLSPVGWALRIRVPTRPGGPELVLQAEMALEGRYVLVRYAADRIEEAVR